MIRTSPNPIDNLLTQLLTQRSQSENIAARSETTRPVKKPVQDILDLSKQAREDQNKNNKNNFTELENGFRRTQKFQTAEGKEFTRIEEITTTPERSKRVVIQQLESGSTTALEDIIDRQKDGSFRLIQRFTDETGETQTNVKLNFNPENADIILGRAPNAQTENSGRLLQRGSQIDLTA